MKLIPAYEGVSETDDIETSDLVAAFSKSEKFEEYRKSIGASINQMESDFLSTIKEKFPDVDDELRNEAFDEVVNTIIKPYTY